MVDLTGPAACFAAADVARTLLVFCASATTLVARTGAYDAAGMATGSCRATLVIAAGCCLDLLIGAKDRVEETLRLGTCLVEVVEDEAEGFKVFTSGLLGALGGPVDRVLDAVFDCTVANLTSRYFLVVGLSGAVKLGALIRMKRQKVTL